MPDYHRTQIQLERWQYEALKARAAEEDVSLSELIRRLVGRELGSKRTSGGRERLRALRGRWRDPDVDGEDHDEVLYGPGEDG